jgi:hypothetical protein
LECFPEPFQLHEIKYGRIIRQAWLELYSNIGGAATTDFSATYKIDNSGSEVIRSTYEMALNGAALSKDIWLWNTASYVINNAHSLNAAASVTARMETLGGFMGVTYEYNNNSGTNPTRLNSIVLGTDTYDKALYINGSSSADKDFRLMEFYIPENNPTLKQSGIAYHLMAGGGVTMGIQENRQQFSRSYILANLVQGGGSMIHHRIDHSTSLALVKGKNVLTSSFLANAANSVGLWGKWAYINYTSDCSPLGEGAHNHTTVWCMASSTVAFGSNYGETGTHIQRSVNIPESKYFLNTVTYEYCLRQSNNMDFGMQMSVSASEFHGSGWVSAIPFTLNWSDFELQPIKFWNDAKDYFNQYPEVTGTFARKLNIKVPKRYRFWTGVSGPFYLKKWVTHHALTSSVNGTITGSAGGEVDIKLIRLDDWQTVLSTTRTGNGAFSMSWYGSETDNYIVMARENANCKGISAAGTPGTSAFNIVLSSSSGGSQGSGSINIIASNYAFIG